MCEVDPVVESVNGRIDTELWISKGEPLHQRLYEIRLTVPRGILHVVDVGRVSHNDAVSPGHHPSRRPMPVCKNGASVGEAVTVAVLEKPDCAVVSHPFRVPGMFD